MKGAPASASADEPVLGAGWRLGAAGQQLLGSIKLEMRESADRRIAGTRRINQARMHQFVHDDEVAWPGECREDREVGGITCGQEQGGLGVFERSEALLNFFMQRLCA